MSKGLVIMGGGSGSGKSILSCGIGRFLSDQGKTVAPFKAIAVLNPEEVGESDPDKNRNGLLRFSMACRVDFHANMNPIQIIKRERLSGELIILGESFGSIDLLAEDTLYTESLSRELLQKVKCTIKESLDNLREQFDHVIIEGAGAPTDDAEDIANQYVADLCDYKIILCARTTRDCLLATLQGINLQLSTHQRKRIAGVVLNSISSPISNSEKYFLRRCESELKMNVLTTIPVLDHLDGFEARWAYLSANIADSNICQYL